MGKKIKYTKSYIKLKKKYLRYLASKYGILKCNKCDTQVCTMVSNKPYSATVDHYIPISQGAFLLKEVSNFRVLCYYCNSSKGDRRETYKNLYPLQEQDITLINRLSFSYCKKYFKFKQDNKHEN